ncbi:MAG TPA: hypothetical protein VGW40_16115 [Allosphingosinicella sp.]|nr:hypothetical protein [Allosphingosinicella sp.]
MKSGIALLALAALAGCGRAAPRPDAAPAFDRAIADDRLALLCDPVRFRLSLRHRADAASRDASYPERRLVDPETLVARFPNHAGEAQYQGGLVRYETCGPFVIRLEGAFLNPNMAGEMGAIPPFAAVAIWADNRMLYPADRPGAIRLSACDAALPIWRECPADYAIRIDLAYRPEAERVAIREWALVDDILNERFGDRLIERSSEVPALLALWWSRRQPPGPRTGRARRPPR